MYTILFLIALSIGIAAYVLYIHNKLMHNNQILNENWLYMDLLLKRRAGIVSRLLQAAQGGMQNEQKVVAALEKIRIHIRRHPNDPKWIKERIQIELELSDALTELLALAEHYPDLQKNEVFINYKNILAKTIEELQEKSTAYNTAGVEINKLVGSIPSKYVTFFTDVSKQTLFESKPLTH